MALRRKLFLLGVALVVAWPVALAAYVLADGQISRDAAAGVVLGMGVLPSLVEVCVIGLLWPVFSAVSSADRDDRIRDARR